MKRHGITLKLVFSIFTFSALIFFGIFINDYLASRGIIVEMAEDHTQDIAMKTVNEVETVMRGVEEVPQTIALVIERASVDDLFTEEELENLLKGVIRDNVDIDGITVAFEPGAYKPGLHYMAPYAYDVDKTENPRIKWLGLEKDQEKIYDYFSKDWYKIPRSFYLPGSKCECKCAEKKLGNASCCKEANQWIGPYFDEGGGGVEMVTYAVPFCRGDKFAGVVTADVTTDWLHKIVDSIKADESGVYGIVISSTGEFIVKPKEVFEGFDVIIDNMIAQKSDFVRLTELNSGRSGLFFYTPVQYTPGWSMGVFYPEEELFDSVEKLKYVTSVLDVFGIFLLALIIVIIVKWMLRPLKTLDSATKEMAKGNLDVDIPSNDAQDEIGSLSRSFSSMKQSLKQHIEELKKTTAEQERIENQLKIARDIQMGFLPKTYPPFPDKTELDVYALIEPARTVGGDLYDFFFIDEERLCFVIGDVADKGIPASLFMAVTSTLFRAYAHQGSTPGEIMGRINDRLCEENDTAMFVTIFIGVLNTKSGEVDYVNAGHTQPLLRRQNGTLELMALTDGIAAGILPQFEYAIKKIRMEKGDEIIMYTDGISEAKNERHEMYSVKRLKKDVGGFEKKPIEKTVTMIRDCVREFVGTEPQSDDIALMVLTYTG